MMCVLRGVMAAQAPLMGRAAVRAAAVAAADAASAGSCYRNAAALFNLELLTPILENRGTHTLRLLEQPGGTATDAAAASADELQDQPGDAAATPTISCSASGCSIGSRH